MRHYFKKATCKYVFRIRFFSQLPFDLKDKLVFRNGFISLYISFENIVKIS